MDDKGGVGAECDPASLQKEDGRVGGMSAFVDGGKEFYELSSGQPVNAAEIQDSVIRAGAGADLHPPP